MPVKEKEVKESASTEPPQEKCLSEAAKLLNCAILENEDCSEQVEALRRCVKKEVRRAELS
jgi:hypothetical protein